MLVFPGRLQHLELFVFQNARIVSRGPEVHLWCTRFGIFQLTTLWYLGPFGGLVKKELEIRPLNEGQAKIGQRACISISSSGFRMQNLRLIEAVLTQLPQPEEEEER